MPFALQTVAKQPDRPGGDGKGSGKAEISMDDRLAFCGTVCVKRSPLELARTDGGETA